MRDYSLFLLRSCKRGLWARFFGAFAPVFVFVVLFALASCGDEEFEGQVSGTALVTIQDDEGSHRVRVVRPGDKVKLVIGATADKKCDLGIVTISQVSHPPIVHYLIDGEEVGTSRDFKSFFSFDYEVGALSPGEHELSVEIPQVFKNIFYNIDVVSSTFTVARSEE